MVTIFMVNEDIARGMVCFFHQKKHSYLIFKIVTSVPDGTEEANPKVGRNVTSVTLPSENRLHADIHVSEISKKSTKIAKCRHLCFRNFKKVDENREISNILT
jgi:hypothetical protein